MKHTPGPWEFATPTMAGNDRIIIEAYGFGSIAAISLNGAPRHQSRLDPTSIYYQEQITTMYANARLIAAAPELLEALKMATYDYEAMSSRDWAHIKELIEKAEGR